MGREEGLKRIRSSTMWGTFKTHRPNRLCEEAGLKIVHIVAHVERRRRGRRRTKTTIMMRYVESERD
jgi:hypothetical protein